MLLEIKTFCVQKKVVGNVINSIHLTFIDIYIHAAFHLGITNYIIPSYATNGLPVYGSHQKFHTVIHNNGTFVHFNCHLREE